MNRSSKTKTIGTNIPRTEDENLFFYYVNKNARHHYLIYMAKMFE